MELMELHNYFITVLLVLENQMWHVFQRISQYWNIDLYPASAAWKHENSSTAGDLLLLPNLTEIFNKCYIYYPGFIFKVTSHSLISV